MSHDRNSPSQEALLIELTMPTGERRSGRLLQMDRAVIVVELSNDGGFGLPVDQQTTMVLPGGPDGPLEMSGRVVARHEEGRRSEYAISLQNSRAIGILSLMCNERPPLPGAHCPRIADRVRPGPFLSVRLEGRELTHEGNLHNVSGTGLAVIVSRAAEEDMATAQVLEIHFEPPAFPESFVMRANICNRSAVVAGIRYGLEFVQEETPASVEGQRRLTEYVRRRRQSMTDRRGA